MSTNLYWRPVKPSKRHEDLPNALKYVLARRLWGHDGSLSGQPYQLTNADIPYLSGIRDVAQAIGNTEIAEGVVDLIGYIDKYEAVEVWLE